jgi:signal transduction histidine kinase
MALTRGALPTRILAYVLIFFLAFGVLPVCVMTYDIHQRPVQDLIHQLMHLRLYLTRYELLRGDPNFHLARPIGLIKTELNDLQKSAEQCSPSDQLYAANLQSSVTNYIHRVSENEIKSTDRSKFNERDFSIQNFLTKTKAQENLYIRTYRERSHSMSIACGILAIFLVAALVSYLLFRKSTEAKLSASNEALNRALAKAEQALENQRQAEQRKEEIIAIVGHELRTPLANASMRLELLDAGVQGKLSEQQIESVRKTRENLAYLIHLINDLLCLERLNSCSLEFSNVDVDSIIERSFERVESLAQTKEIQLCYEPAHFTIRGESTILEQVMVNLLSNAIKFSPAGSAVTVCAKHGEQADEIDVIDHGPGIPEDMLESVFDKFKQSRHDGNETGLGLNICKEIVERHRGILSVRNNEDPGCTFSIELPNAESTKLMSEGERDPAPARTEKVVAHSLVMTQ